jgi:hypothetical protein
MKKVRFIGLDVHADTIAFAEPGSAFAEEHSESPRVEFGGW